MWTVLRVVFCSSVGEPEVVSGEDACDASIWLCVVMDGHVV